MSIPPRAAPTHVPTLTEVIELIEPEAMRPAPAVAAPVPTFVPVPMPAPASVAAPAVAPPSAPASVPLPVINTLPSASMLDEAQIAQRVLADVQRQIDGMLEYRLREALAPILLRSTEALVRELRQELAKTMKDVVARSVTQEIARQRPRT